jgi:hypothetical protein
VSSRRVDGHDFGRYSDLLDDPVTLGPADDVLARAASSAPKRNEDWRSPLELNLVSVMEAIKYALPSLAIRQGCVVNVASSAALGAEPYQGVEYAVAKAGVIRLTTALGTIDGTRVNCICPHTVAAEAVLRSLETRELEDIAPPPPTLLGVDEVIAGARRLIEDDSLSGRVFVAFGRRRARALPHQCPPEFASPPLSAGDEISSIELTSPSIDPLACVTPPGLIRQEGQTSSVEPEASARLGQCSAMTPARSRCKLRDAYARGAYSTLANGQSDSSHSLTACQRGVSRCAWLSRTHESAQASLSVLRSG